MRTTCRICKDPDMARLIELGWNGKMTPAAMSRVLGTIPTAQHIQKHLEEHRGDGLEDRNIPVLDAKSMRERVSALQLRMVNEFERRLAFADQRAAEARAAGNPDADPSTWFDILDKDVQSAMASILKMEAQRDKREMGKAAIGVDIAKLMLGGGDGLAPKRLTGGVEDVIEGVGVEVTDDGSTE